jgi:hypothetical protein
LRLFPGALRLTLRRLCRLTLRLCSGGLRPGGARLGPLLPLLRLATFRLTRFRLGGRRLCRLLPLRLSRGRFPLRLVGLGELGELST